MVLQSILKSLKDEVPAKAEIKGHLDNYKYFDNVSSSKQPARRSLRVKLAWHSCDLCGVPKL